MCRKLIYLVSFILVLSLASNALADLVVHLEFEGDFKDSSGGGHDGDPRGNTTIVYDVNRNSNVLSLPGGLLDGDAVATPAIGDLDEFTIMMWINAETLGSGADKISFFSTPEAASAGLQIQSRAQKLQVLVGTGDGTNQIDGSALALNEWFHLAVTFKSDELAGYINGELDVSKVLTAAPAAAVGEAYIGNWTNPGGEFRRGLTGKMDDVRIYDTVLTAEEIQDAMLGAGPGYEMAADPSPADEQTDVPRDGTLSWTPGIYADKHDVYFGTSFSDVSDANRTNPPGVLVNQNQDPNSYSPVDLLEFGQTYYWRIDEVSAPPDNTVYKGNVWQFTVEPLAYPIAGENITATASSAVEGQEPQNTINGSGLDAGDLHSRETTDMWLSAECEPGQAWIQYELDKVYKLHQMLVWNHNSESEGILGYGLKEVTIEYSLTGEDGDWTPLDEVTDFNQAPGLYDGVSEYAHNTIVNLAGVAAKYVRITAESHWSLLGDFVKQYGLSEVRFFYIPVQARKPKPASGATDMSLDLVLSWRAGRQAATHDVYFSTSKRDVLNGTAPVNNVTEASYGPLSLDLGETYYWRVDEVNDAETPKRWEGDVWNLTTYGYFIVDDFEAYDADENQIWFAWRDGLGFGDVITQPPYYGGNGTGAAIGDETTDSYTEETIVHEGRQSMPYWYDNDMPGKMKYSEAQMTLNSQRDWARRGIKALSLWFRGYPAPVGSFTESPAGTFTMTASGADIYGTSDQFNFAYKTLNGPGTIIAKVESVQNTHGWAKAGVMIRETLDPNSAHAFACITPSNGVAFQGRPSTGGTSFNINQTGITAPHWVRLERDIAGNFTVSHSVNGSTWEPVQNALPETIPMSANVYIGLAVTAHNAAATCEAVFSSVTMTESVGTQWMHQDIGIMSNAAEPMYVAVANNTGMPAVVYHDNPNAAQIDTWTEWNIDLKDFADKGVVLTDVNSIAIGFGNRNNPQAGGSGKMYFDDIRLYRPRYVPGKGTPLVSDLNTDGVVDMADLEVMVADWLASGPALAADVNTDGTIDFKDYAVLADMWLEEQMWPEW